MRSESELRELIAGVEQNITDAQSAQSASTEGRSWTSHQIDALRNQRTALIRELETVQSKRAGGRNPFTSRAVWTR